MCNAPKYGEVEERTGYGGGYNDRGVVEYIERQDSDDEYDEVPSSFTDRCTISEYSFPFHSSCFKNFVCCEIWSVTSREEQGLQAFGNRVQRRIFYSKRKDVIG
jgi:hypothetical protein